MILRKSGNNVFHKESRLCPVLLLFIMISDLHTMSSLWKWSHLVPGHVGGSLNHVVAVPSGDGDEGNSGGVVANLDESNDLNMEIDSLVYEIRL